MFSFYVRHGKPIPAPSHPRGKKYRMVDLPVLQGMKIDLYRQFLSSGIRKAGLARRMGIPKTVVDRLFDLNHHSRLDQIEQGFKALGLRLNVSVERAA